MASREIDRLEIIYFHLARWRWYLADKTQSADVHEQARHEIEKLEAEYAAMFDK